MGGDGQDYMIYTKARSSLLVQRAFVLQDAKQLLVVRCRTWPLLEDEALLLAVDAREALAEAWEWVLVQGEARWHGARALG